MKMIFQSMSNQPQKINNVVKFKDYTKIGHAAEQFVEADLARYKAQQDLLRANEIAELKSKSAALFENMCELIWDDE
jgi:hypothetical protein